MTQKAMHDGCNTATLRKCHEDVAGQVFELQGEFGLLKNVANPISIKIIKASCTFLQKVIKTSIWKAFCKCCQNANRVTKNLLLKIGVLKMATFAEIEKVLINQGCNAQQLATLRLWNSCCTSGPDRLELQHAHTPLRRRGWDVAFGGGNSCCEPGRGKRDG